VPIEQGTESQFVARGDEAAEQLGVGELRHRRGQVVQALFEQRSCGTRHAITFSKASCSKR
jgi:hypothetical protein